MNININIHFNYFLLKYLLKSKFIYLNEVNNFS